MDVTEKIEKAKQILDPKEWTVDKILGGGNFSLGVFRARVVLTGNYYAVKLVEFNSSEEGKYRRRELSLLNKDLSHRNVIRHLHEWTSKVDNDEGTTCTYLCFKMELCLHDLHDHMKSKVSVVKDEDFYRVVFPQILNGLDAIHSMGWVHRDISLTNILVQLPKPKSIREIKVKIGGFMLARRLHVQSSENPDDWSDQATLEQRWPKPERALYEAPELLTDKKHCEKADLYSAGIVLYLLASDPAERNSWPDGEIRALREGERDRTHLCHNNKVLHELLFSTESSLLHDDPECRPSAKEALCKLPLEPTTKYDKSKSMIHDAIAAADDDLELVNDSLGQGSYGKVVSVKHKGDNKLYAVKIICSSPEKYRQRELDILTSQVDVSIMHENIVRYYNSWEIQVEGELPTLCIRLELCDKNLNDVLRKTPEIVDKADFHKIVFMQLLKALKYLHDKKWVHRDIHPGNILLKIPSEEDISSWVVKIADFGLARELPKHGSLVNSDPANSALSHDIGHPEYRAPEINTSDPYDCKVDMYSAGLILYLLCSCFKSEERTEAFRYVRSEEKVKIDVLSHTNEVLYNLMNDLVKRNPENRPSAMEAEVKFSEYLIHQPLSINDRMASVSLDFADGKRPKPENDNQDIDIC